MTKKSGPLLNSVLHIALTTHHNTSSFAPTPLYLILLHCNILVHLLLFAPTTPLHCLHRCNTTTLPPTSLPHDYTSSSFATKRLHLLLLHSNTLTFSCPSQHAELQIPKKPQMCSDGACIHPSSQLLNIPSWHVRTGKPTIRRRIPGMSEILT